MDLPRVMMLIGVSLFLAEGCMLSLFPAQLKRMLSEADPRHLQAAGWVETILALSLMAGIILA